MYLRGLVLPAHREDLCGRHLINRRRVRIALVSLGLLALILVTWWWRIPLLSGIARIWIVTDPPGQADAIVVLGGGLDTRPFAAARLYHEGWAKQVLVLQPQFTIAAEKGFAGYDGSVAGRILRSEQVPAGAIIPVGQTVTSTYDEARAVAAWVRKNGAHRLLIPTDLFHTRRAGWIFYQLLDSQVVEVRVIPIDPPRYTTANWWQTEEGLINFQNEVIKYIWYRWHYRNVKERAG